jgi:hypothetical protein
MVDPKNQTENSDVPQGLQPILGSISHCDTFETKNNALKVGTLVQEQWDIITAMGRVERVAIVTSPIMLVEQ